MRTVLNQVLLFSFFILLIAGSYSSFTSLLNYIHKLHGQEHVWHAQAFFIINSLSCVFFNLFIPNLKIKKLKLLAYTIPLSYLMIYVFTYLGFLPNNPTISIIFTSIAAIFSGIGSSSIWIVSGKYIHLACQVNDSKSEQGKIYGIFGGIMACSFFIGAILSATSMQIIQKKHDLYLILSVIAIIGIFYCKFLVSDLQKPRQLLNESTASSKQNEQLVDKNHEQEKNEKMIQLNFKFNKEYFFKNLLVYKQMSSLFPFQFLNGITVGYIFHCAEDLVFAPSEQTKSTFLTITLIFVGLGSAVGAYTAGHFFDRFGSKKVFLIGVTVCLLSFIMGMVSLAAKIELVSLVTSFISGFGMMYTNNMLIVMCSKNYDGSMMVFAANRQIITISFMLFNIGINVISPQNMHTQMYYELIIFIIIALFCLYMTKYIRMNKYGEKGKAEQTNLNQAQEMNEID